MRTPATDISSLCLIETLDGPLMLTEEACTAHTRGNDSYARITGFLNRATIADLARAPTRMPRRLTKRRRSLK